MQQVTDEVRICVCVCMYVWCVGVCRCVEEGRAFFEIGCAGESMVFLGPVANLGREGGACVCVALRLRACVRACVCASLSSVPVCPSCCPCPSRPVLSASVWVCGGCGSEEMGWADSVWVCLRACSVRGRCSKQKRTATRPQHCYCWRSGKNSVFFHCGFLGLGLWLSEAFWLLAASGLSALAFFSPLACCFASLLLL